MSSRLPDLDFILTTMAGAEKQGAPPAKPAKAAKPTPDLSRVSSFSRGTPPFSAAPTRPELARVASAAARAIYEHCSRCTVCPEAAAFGSIIAPLGCCDEGRRVWKAHRTAMKNFMEVC